MPPRSFFNLFTVFSIIGAIYSKNVKITIWYPELEFKLTTSGPWVSTKLLNWWSVALCYFKVCSSLRWNRETVLNRFIWILNEWNSKFGQILAKTERRKDFQIELSDEIFHRNFFGTGSSWWSGGHRAGCHSSLNPQLSTFKFSVYT